MKKYSVIIAVVLALVLATAAAAQDRLSVCIVRGTPSPHRV